MQNANQKPNGNGQKGGGGGAGTKRSAGGDWK